MTAIVQVRRILVAVDASPHSLAALAAAADLASALDAELAGVFVEDADILLGFELPFIRAQARYAGRRKAFGLDDIMREMQARAAAAASELAATAGRRQLRWTFRTLRGRVPTALLAAAQEADLISLGQASRTTGLGCCDLGSTARMITEQTAVSTLLVAGGQRLRAPVALLVDGQKDLAPAIDIAARLAHHLEGQLEVLVVPPEPADTPEIGDPQPRLAQIDRILASAGSAFAVTHLSGPSHRELRAAFARLQPGLVVLARDPEWRLGDILAAVREACHCPVLVLS